MNKLTLGGSLGFAVLVALSGCGDDSSSSSGTGAAGGSGGAGGNAAGGNAGTGGASVCETSCEEGKSCPQADPNADCTANCDASLAVAESSGCVTEYNVFVECYAAQPDLCNPVEGACAAESDAYALCRSEM
jgi:hypothetical protein